MPGVQPPRDDHPVSAATCPGSTPDGMERARCSTPRHLTEATPRGQRETHRLRLNLSQQRKEKGWAATRPPVGEPCQVPPFLDEHVWTRLFQGPVNLSARASDWQERRAHGEVPGPVPDWSSRCFQTGTHGTGHWPRAVDDIATCSSDGTWTSSSPPEPASLRQHGSWWGGSWSGRCWDWTRWRFVAWTRGWDWHRWPHPVHFAVDSCCFGMASHQRTSRPRGWEGDQLCSPGSHSYGAPSVCQHCCGDWWSPADRGPARGRVVAPLPFICMSPPSQLKKEGGSGILEFTFCFAHLGMFSVAWRSSVKSTSATAVSLIVCYTCCMSRVWHLLLYWCGDKIVPKLSYDWVISYAT